jgi:hypothetical protein
VTAHQEIGHGIGRLEVGDDPPPGWVSWAERPEGLELAREFPLKNQVGLPKLLGRIVVQDRKACRNGFFEFDSMIWTSNQRFQIFSNGI